jgi:malonyl-CoA O-methyltransferase
LTDAYRLDKQRLTTAFEHAARSYDQHAVLQQQVAERMIERLDLVKIAPQRILDAGAGTGRSARLLARRYGQARVLLLDLAVGMLREARHQAPRFFSRLAYVCADVEALPLASGSVDMAFSNLALQWCNDLDRAFAELRRVMRPHGIFMFSTFGPDTLKELRSSWSEVDNNTHVHAFFDMHDIGDALIRAVYSSPVLDVEVFTLTYQDVYGLMRDLKALGAGNATVGRSRSLTGKKRLTKVAAAYEAFRRDGIIPATYEVVYGHAWVPSTGTRPQDGSTVTTFPLTRLRKPRA